MLLQFVMEEEIDAFATYERLLLLLHIKEEENICSCYRKFCFYRVDFSATTREREVEAFAIRRRESCSCNI